MEVLDPMSAIHTLKALTNDKLKLKSTIEMSQLESLENKIMADMPSYIKADLSAPIASMIQLGLRPDKIISELCSMNKLSIFKKEQCLNLLEAIVVDEQVNGLQEAYGELKAKLMEQLELQVSELDDRSVRRALGIMSNLL